MRNGTLELIASNVESPAVSLSAVSTCATFVEAREPAKPAATSRLPRLVPRWERPYHCLALSSLHSCASPSPSAFTTSPRQRSIFF